MNFFLKECQGQLVWWICRWFGIPYEWFFFIHYFTNGYYMYWIRDPRRWCRSVLRNGKFAYEDYGLGQGKVHSYLGWHFLSWMRHFLDSSNRASNPQRKTVCLFQPPCNYHPLQASLVTITSNKTKITQNGKINTNRLRRFSYRLLFFSWYISNRRLSDTDYKQINF